MAMTVRAAMPIEQTRHQQLLKVLAEMSSQLERIAQAVEAINLKTSAPDHR